LLFFVILGGEQFAVVSGFLRKQLQLGDAAPLFVYVNSAFAPTPGEPAMDEVEFVSATDNRAE
jgi:hypothetical protein